MSVYNLIQYLSVWFIICVGNSSSKSSIPSCFNAKRIIASCGLDNYTLNL